MWVPLVIKNNVLYNSSIALVGVVLISQKKIDLDELKGKVLTYV